MNAIQQLLTEHIDIWTAADTEKKSGRGRSSANAASVYGIKKLRELILEIAVRGKLVPQDAKDEPASELLKHIQVEKGKLGADGKIKKGKPLPEIDNDEKHYDLPKGWEWVRNGFLFSLRKGRIPKNLSENNIGVPYLDIDALDRNIVRRYTDDEKCPQSTDNDILVVCDGSRSGFILDGKAGVIGSTLSVIDTPNFIQPYVRLIFKQGYERRNANMKGAAIPHLDTQNLVLEVIGLPPLAEQHRIVAKVDELMALCDQLETQHINAAEGHEKLVSYLLGTLTQSQSAADFSANWQRIAAHFDTLFTTETSIDALKQTLLQLAVMGKLVPQDPKDEPASELLKRMRVENANLIVDGKIKKDKPLPVIADEDEPFALPQGWEWVRLGKLTILGPSNGYSPKPSDIPTDYRCLTLSATTRGMFNADCFKYVDIDSSTAEKYFLKRNDLLIQRANSIDYVGVSAVYDCDDDQFIFPDLIMRMRVSTHVNLNFIHFALSSKNTRSYFKEKATGTQGNMPKINQSTVEATILPLPPLTEQNRIVAKVDELMALCDQLKSRLTVSNQLQQKLANVVVEQAVT